MCVIFYQTKDNDLFTYEDFKNAALTNPHGMGWMANINGQVQYKKGYFNVNEFYNDYIELRQNPDLIDIAVHFRIGTGSAIDIANCHPFPVTKNPKRIKKSHGICDVAIMMNGIIGSSTAEFSDTALYTMKNLKRYYDIDRRWFMHMNKKRKALFDKEIAGCRFVFMSRDGSKLFGSGWSEYENKGQVSNKHWLPRPIADWYGKYYNSYVNSRDYNYSDDDYNYFYDSYDEWYETKRAKRFSKPKNGSKYKSYIDYLEEGI